MKATALLVAGSIALAANAATVADLSQVDLRPYLLVSSHLIIPNTFDPTELSYEEQQQFVTQGGAIFSSLSIQVEQQVPSAQVYRGIATPVQLLDLRNKLNSANIRAQRSCESDTLGFQSGYTDFTWYSIRGKRTTFKVVFARAGSSGLPPCQEPLSQITAALRGFESEILGNPDTEVLLTPP